MMLEVVENKFLSLRLLPSMIEIHSLFLIDSKKLRHLTITFKVLFTMLEIQIHLSFLDQDYKDLSEVLWNSGLK